MARKPFPGGRGADRLALDPASHQAAAKALVSDVTWGPTGGPQAETPRHWVRRAMAAEILSSCTYDDEVADRSTEESSRMGGIAACLPGGTAEQVAAKLALALRESVRSILDKDCASRERLSFALVASALADLVIIGDQPIAPPPRACEAIVDHTDVKFWLDREAARAKAD